MIDSTKSAKSQCDEGCLHCGATLAQTEGSGRVRRYCTPNHGRLYRRRLRALGLDV